MEDKVFENVSLDNNLESSIDEAEGDVIKDSSLVEENVHEDFCDNTRNQLDCTEMEKELSRIKAELETMKLDYLRSVANLENMRRRSEENVQKAYKFSIEKFSKELLPVIDSLEAALKHAGDGPIANEGVKYTKDQLLKALENNDIHVCCPMVGDRFDPYAHQAMAAIVSKQDVNSIVSVMQKGYLLHDRVLRPALVTVAKAEEDA